MIISRSLTIGTFYKCLQEVSLGQGTHLYRNYDGNFSALFYYDFAPRSCRQKHDHGWCGLSKNFNNEFDVSFT